MKTQNYTTQTRILKVSGRIWQGCKCKHEYPIIAETMLATLKEARRIAGDFQSLDSARIVTIEKTVCEKTSVIGLK